MEHTSYRPEDRDPDRLRLSGEVTHEVPEHVRSIIDWNWRVPVRALQLGLRIIRVLAIVREIISCFVGKGHYIACPGARFLAQGTVVDHNGDERQKDACALDCRIRVASETDDLIEEWACNLGKQARADIRCQGVKLQEAIYWLIPHVEDTEPQYKDEGHFRGACGKFGFIAATAARDIIRFARKRAMTI
eukprot:8145955-Pyramimonas_sp.AAC.1